MNKKKEELKIKKLRITKAMKDKVDAWSFLFEEKCIKGTGIAFMGNHFFKGVGVLKKPDSHIHKDVNEIGFLVVGLNNKGTDVIKMVNLTMKIEEAMMMEELFKEAIRRYHLHKQKEMLEEWTE